MSKYTIIVEDNSLDKVVLSLLQSLDTNPLVQLARKGDSFVVRAASKKGKNQREQPELEARFEALFSRWKAETLMFSDGDAIVGHPAYREMIALGQVAVPMMLKKLKTDPHFLLDALTAITGENPVRAENAGKLLKMAEDWLAWGRRKGYDIA